MSERIKDLLHEVADGVEPGERLDAIRAATGVRRPGRGWWTAGGVGLVAASVVTALALSTGSTPRSSEPGPAGTSSADPTTAATDARNSVVAVYYMGDTPDGPRLYREFRRVEGDPLQAAASAAVGRTGAAGPPLAPLDPDYRVPWPPGTDASATLSADGNVIEINLGGDPEWGLHDRGVLSDAEAGLAIEQLIRTAQAAVQERLPVRFLLYDEITDQVLGVPTSEPLAAGSDLAVLAHVSLSDPSEGTTVDNDEPLVVRGLGNSYEGNIVTRLLRMGGRDVIEPQPAIAGTYEDRLFPFEVTLDLADARPGEYVVISQTDDPSGEGRNHFDSRNITIVD